MEDILDDPKFNSDEWVLGAYIRLLAMLNRTKSRDGSIRLSDRQLSVVLGRSRADLRGKRLARGGHLALWTAARYADYTLIMVCKWPKHQGFAPTKLRYDSDETPTTTPTPTPTPNTDIVIRTPQREKEPARRGKKPTTNGSAEHAYPAVREAVLTYGKRWGESPQQMFLRLAGDRMQKDSLSEAQLVQIVHGAVRFWRGSRLDEDWVRVHLRPQTLFAPSHWEGYLDSAREESAKPSIDQMTDDYYQRLENLEDSNG